MKKVKRVLKGEAYHFFEEQPSVGVCKMCGDDLVREELKTKNGLCMICNAIES